MKKQRTCEESAQRIKDLEREVIKLNEAEQEANERYIALFDRGLFLVFVHDLDGNFLEANDTALAFFGYTKEEISSLNNADIAPSFSEQGREHFFRDIRKTAAGLWPAAVFI